MAISVSYPPPGAGYGDVTVCSSPAQNCGTELPSPARIGRNGSRCAAACKPQRSMPSSISRASIAPLVRACANHGS
ncbi:Uncharacterised protein [Mycobacterium tuberculosis]|nr:Uncharacterised protein [Mycobacterium tuberculosis]